MIIILSAYFDLELKLWFIQIIDSKHNCVNIGRGRWWHYWTNKKKGCNESLSQQKKFIVDMTDWNTVYFLFIDMFNALVFNV